MKYDVLGVLLLLATLVALGTCDVAKDRIDFNDNLTMEQQPK